MTHCRIFKITFPNEFSKENFDSYIVKTDTNEEIKKDFIRMGMTVTSNQGIYINIFESENDAIIAWVKRGKELYAKIKSLGAKVEKFEGDAHFLNINTSLDLSKYKK